MNVRTIIALLVLFIFICGLRVNFLNDRDANKFPTLISRFSMHQSLSTDNNVG